MATTRRTTLIWLAIALIQFFPALPARAQTSLHFRPLSNPTHTVENLYRVGKIGPVDNTATMRADLALLANEVDISGRLAIPLPEGTRILTFEPNEIRTPEYANGSTPRTYRGSLSGIADSQARIYLDANYFGGMIRTSTGVYVIETTGTDPGSRVSTVLIQRFAAKKCSACEANSFAPPYLPKGGGPAPIDPGDDFTKPIVNRTIVQRSLTVITDCDFEYVQKRGGAAVANARALSWINQLDPFFQKDIGIRLRVGGQVVRTAENPVYTAATSRDLRFESQTFWEQNPQPARSFVLTLTGKDLVSPTDGGTSSLNICHPGEGVVAREADPARFGPFGTINLLGSLFVDQINANLPLQPGDPECSPLAGAVFVGQAQVNGEILAQEFCWKTLAGISARLAEPSAGCVVGGPDTTVRILTSTSRVVPASGGQVTFQMQVLPGTNWVVASRAQWISVLVNRELSRVEVQVAPLPKGRLGARIGDVVINGEKIPILQQ